MLPLAFANALGDRVKHRRTRPSRPQTNGKVERFNRSLAAEWAYAEVYLFDDDRDATYADWLHFYNHHRPTPASEASSPPTAFTTSRGTTPSPVQSIAIFAVTSIVVRLRSPVAAAALR